MFILSYKNYEKSFFLFLPKMHFTFAGEKKRIALLLQKNNSLFCSDIKGVTLVNSLAFARTQRVLRS